MTSSIMEKNGNVVPILLNKDHKILDGHNRFTGCQEENIEPKAEICNIEFQNRDEEKLFIINLNLNRRHLNKFGRIELALKSKPIYEKIAKEKQRIAGITKVRQNSDEAIRVDKKIADDAHNSRDTVRNVEVILAQSDIKDITKTRLGKQTIHQTWNHVKRNELRK